MSQPTLKKFKASVKYTTGGGSVIDFTHTGPCPDSPRATPNGSLIGTISELVRIGCIAGLESEIKTEVEGAIARVAAWKATL